MTVVSDIAQLLIAHKADVNAVDKDEVTALMIACEKGNVDLVSALLKAGADVNKKSKIQGYGAWQSHLGPSCTGLSKSL
ncbi:MAG: ankyrin repeat domain-containing protein [Desulfobacterales bacterium]|nr:ankyrin repeat domain-containing protein [Desulfobacterales bacterium]